MEADTAAHQQSLADYDINILSAQAKIEQARADLRSAEIDLSYCRMTAPIRGRIGQLQVKLGNLVGSATSSGDSTSLVTVQQLDPMGVDLRPPSRYLPIITRLVKQGLEIKLRVEGQRDHPYTGKITFLDNTVDATTSTVLVKAEVPNPEELILPGEYVKVELTIGDYSGGLVIPDAAVVEAQEGSRVLIVDDQNNVKLAVIKVLDVYQGLAVVESGLAEGQKVIVKGVQLARPGQTVKAEEAELETFSRPDSDSVAPDALDSPLMRCAAPTPRSNTQQVRHNSLTGIHPFDAILDDREAALRGARFHSCHFFYLMDQEEWHDWKRTSRAERRGRALSHGQANGNPVRRLLGICLATVD